MRNRTALGLTSGLVLSGLVVAGWTAGYALGQPTAAVTAASTPVAAASSPVLTASAVTTPSPARAVRAAAKPAPVRRCSVAGAASSPALGSFRGRVVNAKTGEVLFDRKGGTGARAASVMKVLTSAAALQVLGPDHRLKTAVVAGANPGEIVLVGGGDVTLRATAPGDATFYPGAAHLATLAEKAKAAWKKDPTNAGRRISRIVLDASYFGGRDWHPTWKRSEQTIGYMPEIAALMVDGDRANPDASTSPRSTDPVGRAGAAFQHYFSGAQVVRGTAPAGAKRLAVVRSAPVRDLVHQTLLVSDNAIAEALARVVAVESGAGNRFADIDDGVVGALQGYGVDTAGVRVVDGSGLSDDNRIPPKYLTSLFRKIRVEAQGLEPVREGLPVAGRSGSLSYGDRFAGSAARARGNVLAKTGWIDSGITLSGIIRAKDGTPLTFAFYALRDGYIDVAGAKSAIDSLTADVWSCGNRLSNR